MNNNIQITQHQYQNKITILSHNKEIQINLNKYNINNIINQGEQYKIIIYRFLQKVFVTKVLRFYKSYRLVIDVRIEGMRVIVRVMVRVR